MIATTAVAQPRFNARRVFAASLGAFRSRWGTIVTLVIVDWGIRVLPRLTGFAEFRHGSQDLAAFAASEVYAIAIAALDCLAGAAIVAVGLGLADGPRPLVRATRAALRVFLPLLPYYVLANGPSMLWGGWSDWFLPRTTLTSPLWLYSILAVEYIYDLVLTAFFGLVVPAALVEGGNAIASMRRSAALLTSGRWRFLGLSVLIDLASVLIGILVGLSVGALAFRPSVTPLVAHAAIRASGLIGALIGALLAALWPVVTAVSYQALRNLHQGAPED